MYKKNKKRFYVSEILDNPAVAYPSYYILSCNMAKNEMLHGAIVALHSFDFSNYKYAKNHEEVFAILHSGMFAIYKERYIVGYFANKMMYLESNGWKSLPATEDVFKIEYWLVC